MVSYTPSLQYVRPYHDRLANLHRRILKIWLAAIGGAKPAGQRVPVNGNPYGTFKIASKFEFQVWKGVVGVPVISIFPAQEGRRFTSFQAGHEQVDLKKVLGKF